MAYDPASATQAALIARVNLRADVNAAEGMTTPIPPNSVYLELEDAARTILTRSPKAILLPAATDGTTHANTNKTLLETNTRLVIPLPTDFVRFVRIRLTEHKRAIDSLGDPDSKAYHLATTNQYAAPTIHSPAAFHIPYYSGLFKQALEIFPVSTVSTPVSLFSYIGTVAPENMPASLVDALVWEAAGRVLQNLRENAAAAAGAYEKAAAELQRLTGREGE